MQTIQQINSSIASYLELEYPNWVSRMKRESYYLSFLEEFTGFYFNTLKNYKEQGDREDIAHEQAYRDMICHIDMDYQDFDDRKEHLN